MHEVSRTIRLRVSECDLANRWRLGAAMIEMQEIAGEQSEKLGCGRSALLEEGLAWVASRMEIRMNRYPVYGEEITLRTFYRPQRHRLFPRYFQFFGADGELLGQASSLWLLMDLNTRQSVDASLLPRPLPDNSDAPEPLPLPGGIVPLDAPEEPLIREIRYTDLDSNGHVNNTKYADWLCDALGTETLEKHPLERFVIHYDSEIRPGQPVELRLQRADLKFRMIGIHDGRTAFSVGGTLMDSAG